jgi:hypothetical protein
MRRMVLGSEEYPLQGNLIGDKEGIAYFCPTCAELWAKAFLGKTGLGWMVSASPCSKHGRDFSIGGSIIMPLIWWDPFSPRTRAAILDSLCPGLVYHETLMHIEHVLKERKI